MDNGWHLVLLFAGEYVDNPVYGSCASSRVKRSKNKVPCFGSSYRSADSFEVSHLADKYYIRVLPEAPGNCFRKSRYIDSDFSLGYQAGY